MRRLKHFQTGKTRRCADMGQIWAVETMRSFDALSVRVFFSRFCLFCFGLVCFGLFCFVLFCFACLLAWLVGWLVVCMYVCMYVYL